MTVVMIIMILCAITVAGMGFINDRQARAKAEVDIKYLSQKIEQYKVDTGEYPGLLDDSPIDGDISEELYEVLFLEGYNSEGDVPIYIPSLDPTNSKQSWVKKQSEVPNTPLKIFDPWRNNYRYRKGVNSENPDFDLWSVGKDGKSGTSDDIGNF